MAPQVQSHPTSGTPLMKGKTPKSEQGCCARHKRTIVIVVVVAVILIIAVAVTLVMLMPTEDSTPAPAKSNASSAAGRARASAQKTTKLPPIIKPILELAGVAVNSTLDEGSGGEPVDTPSEGVIDLDVVESEENPLEAFVGNWKLESQENFGEFLKAIGVGYFQRSMAESAKPEMTVTVEEPGKITVESRGLKSGTKTIVFDEEFEEKTGDGRNVLSLHTIDGSKWVSSERWGPAKDEKIADYVREIVDDKFIVTISFSDLICIQRYVRIE